MAIIVKEIKLETTRQNLIQAVIAKQNDCNSRFLKVTFLDEGAIIPLHSTAKVTINANRKDGVAKNFFGEVNEDNTATVPLHSWILELDGNVECDVSILEDDGSKLTTTSFVVIVEKAACGSDNISTDPQYDVLANLIEEVSGVTGDLADCVKITDIATNDTHGIVKGESEGKYGIMVSSTGEIQIRRATTDDINARKHTSRPIVPANLKQAVTSVFEDVYGEVYVETGKLKSLVSSLIADVMNSIVLSFWDGDVWPEKDISVSVDNLENVPGEFVGQIIYIRTPTPAYEVYMYLGCDVMSLHVWTKLGELPD